MGLDPWPFFLAPPLASLRRIWRTRKRRHVLCRGVRWWCMLRRY